MKDIKSALKKIDIEEKTIEKIAKFLKTKKGMQFVSNIHTASMKELQIRYNAPKFILLHKDDNRNKNLVLAAMKKYNITAPKYNPIKFSKPVKTKYQIYLTKEQYSNINTKYLKKKMGFAALMHAYEEYMMSKFIAKHPAPTERELAEDLFPEELKAGYNNILYIRREYVRNLLCKKYAKTTPKETFFRIFTVLSVTKDPATERKHEPVISEVEAVDCYAFTNLNKNTDKTTIEEKLKRQAKAAYQADKHAIKVKLYDKYGNLIGECNCK